MDELDDGMHNDNKFLMLVNGMLREPLRPERGIRKGDQLSPY